MGEGWFEADERIMFQWLVDQEPRNLPLEKLSLPLGELANGTMSHGDLDEWYDWYFYLLGQLVPRAYEYTTTEYLVEYLITGMISQYPDGIRHEPYDGFIGDVLTTLGRCHMDGHFWTDNEIRLGTFLHRKPRYVGSTKKAPRLWGWRAASSDFSAQMFLYLKYLPADGIECWVRSLLSIPCAHWNAQVMVWLLGARRFLNGEISQPDEFPSSFKGPEPSIDWAWSHCLRGSHWYDRDDNRHQWGFVAPDNLSAFRDAIANYLDSTLFETWLRAFEHFDYLKSELGALPKRFESAYLE